MNAGQVMIKHRSRLTRLALHHQLLLHIHHESAQKHQQIILIFRASAHFHASGFYLQLQA